MSTPETNAMASMFRTHQEWCLHSARLERQRDAYAETLRIIATANDRSHHEAAFATLIRNRHPELTP